MIDVTVRRTIAADAAAVAAVMFDPRRDTDWIGGARRVEVLGPEPYGMGTRVRRYGAFLGRTFSWTTEVVEFSPGRLVHMRHIAGPFKGGVDYAVAARPGRAEVTIRNYGEANFWFPFMSAMMRASVGKDLARLSRLLHR